MQEQIDIREVDKRPELVSTTVTLRSGKTARFRPLAPGDAGILAEYFLGLRPETVDMFRPHDFDQATADKLCASINSAEILRMIAISDAGGKERVIGYFLLRFGISEGEQTRYSRYGVTLDTATDCTIAPSVADDWQNQGLGTLLFSHLIDVARRAGRKRIVLWGGVRGINARAIHFYTKHGFRRVGDFEVRGNNHDMLLEL